MRTNITKKGLEEILWLKNQGCSNITHPVLYALHCASKRTLQRLKKSGYTIEIKKGFQPKIERLQVN